MCWVEKGFLCLTLDRACIALGVVNLILSIAGITVSIIAAHFDENCNLYLYISSLINMDMIAYDAIVTAIYILSIVNIISSLLLIVGVKKNKANCVLSYFVCGVITSIVIILGALLELLQGLWFMALVQLAISPICIHCLVVVHSTYEVMVRGKTFGTLSHDILEEEVTLDV